jgi:hypothetical protein
VSTRKPWKRIDAIGISIAVTCCLFAARLGWEQTVWTWERGPQMVGFSLMHSGAGILLPIAFLLAGPLWVMWAMVFSWRTRSLGTAVTWASLLAYVGAWGVLSMPGWVWERAFIERMARSPKAPDLIFSAAVRGDLKTVEAYIAQGVPVNARTCAHAFTPIHGAARGGDVGTIKFLISQGADVNLTNAYGDSPLCEAEERDLTAAIELLLASGAKRVVGTPAQRDAATKAFVSRSTLAETACLEAQAGQPAQHPCKSGRWLVQP